MLTPTRTSAPSTNYRVTRYTVHAIGHLYPKLRSIAMQFRKELVDRALTLVTLAAFVVTMLITPGVASAQTTPPTHGALSVPITGGKATVPGSNAASNFTGSFTIQQFIAQGDKLFAV